MPLSPSTLDRPLRLSARADIIAAAVRVAEGGRWVVTDPVTRAHFELSEEEYALLTWLDNRTSLRELQRRFERRFAPRRIDAAQLWQYLSRLHREGLVARSAAGQGDELWGRDRKRRRDEWLWSWTKILAIRLPSVDADRFITSLHGVVGWVFRPWALLLLAMVALLGIGVAIRSAGQLAADMPSLATLALPQNLLWIVLVAVGVKVLHELGHAVTCKHFGGEVREMGVLLLAFAPCLFCDVSDMWRLPSRAKRMAVSAAGMAVELMLASVAVLVWRFAEPGIVSSLALSVMIVCTVGTVLVNANPLLRYDGYYLLTDLTNTSNLWTRSREAARDRLSGWLFRPSPQAADPPAWPLALFGVASQAYVLLVVGSILWLLMATLRPLHLESVAWLIGGVSIAAVAAGPTRQFARWARDPAATIRLRRGRATLAIVATVTIIALGMRMPWTYTVEAQAVTVIDGAEEVVTTVGGELIEAVAPGTIVRSGDVVARLKNPTIEQELIDLRGQLAEQTLRVDQLGALRRRDAQARDSLPAEQATLADLQRRLADRQADAKRLVLRASRAGVVIAPPRVALEDGPQDRLPRWTGSPLDAANLNAWLEPGTLVGLVGDPERIAVEALLPEADVERLRQSQSVRLAMRQTPGRVLRGKVTRTAMDATRGEQPTANPAQISNFSPLTPPPATAGAHYRIRVALDAHDMPLKFGGSGRAKIETGGTTLGRWLADGLRQTFRIP